MDKKQDPSVCFLQETQFRHKDTCRLKVKGEKSIYHTNGSKSKAGVAMPILEKIDFKTKTTTRNKEEHYTLIRGTIQQENITNVNIYAPNMGAPKYIKQLLPDIEEAISSHTTILGDFNTQLTSMDRSSRQKNQQGNSSFE